MNHPSRSPGLREFTLRGVILGALITLAFTAANVYLGLKVGLTFATSIPAAVISMALLRYMAGSTILENNIVQTIASAAGTLAAIIFVLPGLVMVGYWQGFPMIETTAMLVAMIAEVRKVLSIAKACSLSIDRPIYQFTEPSPLTGLNVTTRGLPSASVSLMSVLIDGVFCG